MGDGREMRMMNLSNIFSTSVLAVSQSAPLLAPGPTELKALASSPFGTPLATPSSPKIFVDVAATGANDGTSLEDAFTTIQAAVDTATAGDVIVIKGGTYREAVELKSSGTENNPIVLTRYGSERPKISGALPLTGWTACTDQVDALGSPNWTNCYKAFVPATSVFNGTGLNQNNGINLGLLQDGTPLRLAINAPGFTDGLTNDEKVDRAFNRRNDAWFFQTGSGTSTTLTNAEAAADYTGFSDLTNAYAVAHFNIGNNVDLPKITGLSGNVFRVDGGKSSHTGRMAVLNAGVDLNVPGFWCFKDTLEGDGTRKVVVYPRDGADLSASGAEIEYCDEWSAVSIQAQDWWTIYGIDAYGQTGHQQFKGIAFGSGATKPNGFANNSQVNEGIIFEQCRARYLMSNDMWAAGFRIDGAQKCSVINCDSGEVEGQGIAISDGATGAPSNDNFIYGNEIRRMHFGGIRPHTQTRLIMAYNNVLEIESAHANGASIYIDSRDCLIHGNRIRTKQGIGFTHQESNNLWFLFNDIQSPPNELSKRGLENNSRNPEEVVGTRGVIVYLNNTSGPATTSQAGGSSIVGGKTANTDHYILNNVGQGGIDPGPENTETARTANATSYPAGALNDIKDVSNNLLTSDNGYLPAFLTGQTYSAGTGPDFFDQLPKYSGNLLNTILDAVFVDVANGDYRPVVAGPLDSGGLDPSRHTDEGRILPDLSTWYRSDYNYQRDAKGKAVTWDALPIGCYLP